MDDDPWDWSVAQVVQELCTSNRSWQTERKFTFEVLPNTLNLKSKIEEEEITGSILLTSVSEEFMKNDLGLRKLAWRAFIASAIEELRLKSLKYQNHVEKHLGGIRTRALYNARPSLDHHYSLPNRSSPFAPAYWPNTPATETRQSLQQETLLEGGSPLNIQKVLLSRDHTGARPITGDFATPGLATPKRRKLDHTQIENDAAVFQPGHAESEKDISDPNYGQTEISAVDVNGKKRKRIAPTLVTSEIDPTRDRDIPTAADDVVQNDPQNVEPGVAFLGDDGRKRMVPILESGSMSTQLNYSLLVSKPKITHKPTSPADLRSTGYLGKRKMLVDDIFYEGIAVSQDIQTSPETAQEFYRREKISGGRRLYVHTIMKHFLRSETRSFLRDGRSYYAVLPYPAHLIPRYHSPSFTLFTIEQGEIRARREPLSLWPEADFEGVANESQPRLLDGISSADGFDPDSLARYQYLPGGEDILPIYGDSDEENEYDPKTWKEIEKEQKGTLALSSPKRLKRLPISLEQVYEAVDEAVRATVAKWKAKKLPKLQQQAFNMWKKHRSFRRLYLKRKNTELVALEQRIAKQRQEIAKEQWSSSSQVHKQAQIMEPSIFSREKTAWEIALLESKTAPERPSNATPRKIKPIELDSDKAETLNSGSSSSDDCLDDFIEDDDQNMAKLDLADVEDEDDDDLSDTGSLEVPIARKLIFKKSIQVVADEAECIPVVSHVKHEHDSKLPRHAGTPEHPTVVDLLSSDDSPDIHHETIPKRLSQTDPKGTAISPINISDSENTPKRPRLIIRSFSRTLIAKREDDSVETSPRTPIKFRKMSQSHEATAPNDPKAHAEDQDETAGNTKGLDDRSEDQGGESEYANEPDIIDDGGDGESEDDEGQDEHQDEEDEEDEGPRSSLRRRRRAINTSDEDNIEQHTPHKVKRKKKVYENEDARDLREQDRLKQAKLEERRRKLQAALAKSSNDDQRIILNESKEEHQGLVYIDPNISKRIKPHQIDGVRFMWDQIVVGKESLQGCLLAHTMGLGKTMQVITLLVAIASAAKSDDESVSSQIPISLRASRTLVLCPPGLIDNWMDELLTWAPTNDVLGRFFKIDSSKTNDRLQIIDAWYVGGGVLILGYEMFRNFIHNQNTEKRGKALDQSQHEQILEQLTRGPNIIVADEAHKMKNTSAAITTAASIFRSNSRIALTGSPLANNVLEYHTMIEWIAPNYLGPIVEFKAKYAEPIQDGTYFDSSPQERRTMYKMLGVLKEDLSPKVHRADMSVLKDALPPKVEFVITVPLTELQREAYSIYVQCMTSNSSGERTKDGEFKQTTLWHWLAVLSLLCNHPDCFWRKLNERKEEASQKAPSTPLGTDSEAEPFNADSPIWKTGSSATLIQEEKALFEKEPDLTSIELSRKVQILCQILDAAKECGDKTLVFSHSIATLDFLDKLCQRHGRKFARLDGKTPMKSRQGRIKAFNEGHLDTYLISTKAGGLGLNLFGANRVVIFDFGFNPILEEQAVGRAYRIGQKKKVFVYRFVAGGTFEDSVHNKSVFKKQLASRVVDKKNPIARATRNVGEFLFEPREVPQKDLSEFEGLDPVLDKILALQSQDNNTIRAIVQTDTFETDDEVVAFTKDEKAEVAQMLIDSKLKRTDPRGWDTLMASRQQEMITAARLKNIYPVIAGQLSATGAIIPATQPAYTSVQQNFREGLQVRPRSSLPLGSEASPASSPSNKAPSTSSSAVTDPKPNSSGTTAADMNQVCLPSIPYSQNLIPASTIGSQSHQSVADSIRARMQSLTHYHPKD